MAQFITCGNSGINFFTFMPNLIMRIDTLAGTTYGGINSYIVPTITNPLVPYVCTANDTLDSLLKRCLELDCCGRAAFRFYIVSANECPEVLVPCGANPGLLFEGLKWCFVETDVSGELAFVLIDMYNYCRQI